MEISVKRRSSIPFLFGYKGWLIAVLVYITISAIGSAIMIGTGSYKNMFGSTSIWFFLPTLILTPVFLYLAFKPSKYFRYGAGLYYLIVGLDRAYLIVVMLSQTNIHLSFLAILNNSIPLILGLYILLSKRVRVTICNELPLYGYATEVDAISNFTNKKITDISANETVDTSSLDRDLYEEIANELVNAELNKGLWTKLYTEYDGDETKAKVAYIKIRAQELKNKSSSHINELTRTNITNSISPSSKNYSVAIFSAVIVIATTVVFLNTNNSREQQENINQTRITPTVQPSTNNGKYNLAPSTPSEPSTYTKAQSDFYLSNQAPTLDEFIGSIVNEVNNKFDAPQAIKGSYIDEIYMGADLITLLHSDARIERDMEEVWSALGGPDTTINSLGGKLQVIQIFTAKKEKDSFSRVSEKNAEAIPAYQRLKKLTLSLRKICEANKNHFYECKVFNK